jgi:hypothetical protein
VQSQPILTIDPKHRLVEGVASDGSTIWVSSVLDRQILACRTDCRILATLPAGLHPFAIAWDHARQRLWVAADCPSGVAGIQPCDRGALIGLNSHGRIMTRVAPFTGSFHPGDVSASPAGVFVSDGQNGAVYGYGKEGRGLLRVSRSNGKSAQGTATDAEAKHLLVADYSEGIARIELATGARTLLPGAGGTPLRGIDGLVRCGSTFYGIYNGTAPGALLAIRPADTSVNVEKPLGETPLIDPTQIAYDGKRLLIVANSGWADIEKPDFARPSGATILSLPLSADCTVQ